MSKKLIDLTGTLLLVLLLLAVPVAAAMPPQQGPRPPVEPGPRPPSNEPPEEAEEEEAGEENDDDDDRNGVQGAIYGTVTDLSTDGPGVGLDVWINGAVVTTDWDGCFSLTGQPAGTYGLELDLPAEWLPDGEPVTVYLDGENMVTVDLAYYSQPPPEPEPARPDPEASAPADLPESGAARDGRSFIIAGLALLLAAGLLRASQGLDNLR